VAAHFKKAAESAARGVAGGVARVILIDEAGFLMRPLVRRSLAPRGNPLVLRYRSNHRQKVSVQGAVVLAVDGRGGVTVEALRARTHEDSYVDGEKTAAFLRRLLAEYGGPVTVVWDRGNMHKGPHVRAVLEAFPRLAVEQFPPYCPDLDPVEWLWAWAKYGQMANLAPRDLRHLTSEVAKLLARAADNQTLLDGFVRAAGLATTAAVATAETDRALAG
jgi:transposase